jgi:hypothetical protein
MFYAMHSTKTGKGVEVSKKWIVLEATHNNINYAPNSLDIPTS